MGLKRGLAKQSRHIMTDILRAFPIDENPFGKPTNQPHTPLPSRFQINDPVELHFNDSGAIKNCSVIKVHFTEMKVLYDVEVECHYANLPVTVIAEDGEQIHKTTYTDEKYHTRLYNIDSANVYPKTIN